MATPHHTVTVCAVRNLTPRLRRVTVTGESLREMDVTGAPEIALALLDETGRPVRRRYTARSLDRDRAQLEIDVVLHGHGPGSTWGQGVEVGEELSFTGPRARIDLGPASWYLLIADEAGLPAVAALLEQAPSDTHAVAVLEVHDSAERLDLAGPARSDVRWAYRDGRPAGRPDTVLGALEATVLPAGPVEAWVLCESRAGSAIRDQLVQRGVPRSSVHVKGYWNLGRERPVGPAVRAVASGDPITAVVPITPT